MLQQLHLGAPGGKDEKAREITMTPGEKGLFPPGGKGLAAGWGIAIYQSVSYGLTPPLFRNKILDLLIHYGLTPLVSQHSTTRGGGKPKETD